MNGFATRKQTIQRDTSDILDEADRVENGIAVLRATNSWQDVIKNEHEAQHNRKEKTVNDARRTEWRLVKHKYPGSHDQGVSAEAQQRPYWK